MRLDKLDTDGRFFLDHARGIHGDRIPAERVDVRHFRGGYDDLTYPIVRLVSRIAESERLRRFGIEALGSRSDWTGRYGPDGGFIPTDDFISRLTRCYGDAPARRSVEITPRRSEALAEAINRTGRALRSMLAEGEYDFVTA